METFIELKQYIWTLFLAFMGWVWWSFKKRFVPREDFDKAVGSNLARIEKLEVKISTLPTADELRALKETMSDVKGEIRVFNERHINSEQDRDRMERQLGRIEQFLMSEKK